MRSNSRSNVPTAVAILIATAIAQTSLARDGRGTEGEGTQSETKLNTPQGRDTDRGQARSVLRLAQGETQSSSSSSDTSKINARVNFDIPAQPLSTSLKQVADQAGIQILFEERIVSGITAPEIRANQSTLETLKALLKGTDLEFTAKNETVAVRSTKPIATSLAPEGRGTEGEGKLRLAQNENTGNASEENKDQSKTGPNSDSNENQNSSELKEIDRSSTPEIFVKGSRVLNMDIKRSRDDIQPYVVFDRKTIEASESQNIEDFLRNKLTSVSSPTTGAQTGFLGGDTTSKINLRGLGSEQTLILVDGHRVAAPNNQGSPLQPDLNGIPLAAIERIEVLPVTASGIYGGSATGGVINVVLRRDYSGVETGLTYGNSFDGGGAARRADLAAGFDFEGGKTMVLLTGSYSDSSNLPARDRNFLRRGRAHILANNPSALLGASPPPVGETTNIATPSQFDFETFQFVPGPNLVLDDGTPLNANSTFVPVGYAGAGSDNGAAFVLNAGQFNLNPAHTAQIGVSGDMKAA